MLNAKESSSSSTSPSPSETTITESVRTAPTTNLQSQFSRQTPISEHDDEQKGNQSSSRSSRGSSATESTLKPKSTPVRAIPTTGLRRLNRRNESSASENSSVQNKSNALNKTTINNSTIQKLVDRNIGQQVNAIKNNKSSTFTPQTKSGNLKLSVFEKVDRHNGHSTYLGSGTFSQLENCIRNCLTQDASHNSSYYSPTTLNSTHKTLTRASVLEDYSYEGITAPREQINISTDKLLGHSHSHHDYHHSSHHIKHAAELPIDEIRQVNDALAKYGIPVFSHVDQSNNLYGRPRPIGEVLSVCQQLLNDPSLRSQQTSAVQHVWDNIHYHSPQTYMQGYASPAVKGVASHLFGNPNQPPYSPVQSVASNIFNNPPQNSYYSTPPPSFPSYQPSSYPPPPPPPPPQFGPNSAGQSVLSRLFSR